MSGGGEGREEGREEMGVATIRLCAMQGSTTGGEEIDGNNTGARTKEKMKDGEGAHECNSEKLCITHQQVRIMGNVNSLTHIIHTPLSKDITVAVNPRESKVEGEEH